MVLSDVTQALPALVGVDGARVSVVVLGDLAAAQPCGAGHSRDEASQ
jgi:hypothetical protein